MPTKICVYFKSELTILNLLNYVLENLNKLYIYSLQVFTSVATKYSQTYLVRVLSNYFKKVFSTSTLRGVFQKYLVRVLNTL